MVYSDLFEITILTIRILFSALLQSQKIINNVYKY